MNLVLVVEDKAEERADARKAFAEVGFETAFAQNLLDGRRLLGTLEPIALATDLHFPEWYKGPAETPAGLAMAIEGIRKGLPIAICSNVDHHQSDYLIEVVGFLREKSPKGIEFVMDSKNWARCAQAIASQLGGLSGPLAQKEQGGLLLVADDVPHGALEWLFNSASLEVETIDHKAALRRVLDGKAPSRIFVEVDSRWTGHRSMKELPESLEPVTDLRLNVPHIPVTIFSFLPRRMLAEKLGEENVGDFVRLPIAPEELRTLCGFGAG